MPLVLNGATSGSTTLQSTDAVTATITLPSTTGTVITTGNIPTGSVVQVVNATYGSTVSTGTNTFVTTGLTASITPTSSSNKILVLVSLVGVLKNTGNTCVATKLYRNGSSLFVIDDSAGTTGSTAANGSGSISLNYLDSPATTSSTTYAVFFASDNNINYAYINAWSNIGAPLSTITLMEIKA